MHFSKASLVRWSARVLSLAIIGFWGFFMIAHLVDDKGGASRPLTAADYVGLTAMVAWLVGLAIAWKWELIGGSFALLALLVVAVTNPNVLSFPGTLILVTAMLYLASWWIHREGQPAPS